MPPPLANQMTKASSYDIIHLEEALVPELGHKLKSSLSLAATQ